MTTMPTVHLTADDELPHPPGEEPSWIESWTFDVAVPDGSLAAFVRLTLVPRERVAWYWACVVGADRDPVVVVDHEVPLPKGRSLELRAEGLWADHIVEEPFDHVSVGCEAFALRLDGPEADVPIDPRRPLLGERTPFGLDLGWETAGEVTALPAGYTVPSRVVGEVLVGSERFDLDAAGPRCHLWGPGAWPGHGEPDGGKDGGQDGDVRSGSRVLLHSHPAGPTLVTRALGRGGTGVRWREWARPA